MDENEDMEDMNTYVIQLKSVFDSCDVAGQGLLNVHGLRELCEKLHLSEHADHLINRLLEQNSEVNFENFKECFVAILSQNISTEEITKDLENEDDVADREISPKFTLGRKKYGRRSRPASIIEEDNSICDSSNTDKFMQECSSAYSSSLVSAGENIPGKRPMSPSDSQQPPTKSGRMRCDHEISYASSLPSSDSEHSFENNPVEYLQDTWKKLGIGQNGFLNVEELARVCEHIGMDMTEEVVAQLFQKLDCDQDGQISIEEFLQGLFQHGDPQQCDSLCNKSNIIYNQSSMDDQISNSWPAGMFSCIDPNNSGSADASSILELWESLELACPPRLLEELGFNTSRKINLTDLTSTFEEILANALNRPVLQLAFATFQNELHYLRQTISQMQDERKKLKINIEEANARAALLAQEVDDNHAKLESSLQRKLSLLEKKYQDQTKELIEELQQERDTVHFQASKLKQFQQEMACTQEEENKMKTKFNLMQQENCRLEQDVREISEKCLEMEKLNESLQKELATVPDLKKRLSELESHFLQEQQHQSLLLELEQCKKSNQEMKDKIDELTLEMENIQRNCVSETTPSKSISRNHSWLSDYKNTSSVSYKRRGSESSSEENSDEDSLTLLGVKKPYMNEKQGDELNFSENVGAARSLKPRNAYNPNNSVDVLLKDMLLDQSVMMKKLQVAEEKCLKTERAYRSAENRIKVLSQILKNMAGTVIA